MKTTSRSFDELARPFAYASLACAAFFWILPLLSREVAAVIYIMGYFPYQAVYELPILAWIPPGVVLALTSLAWISRNRAPAIVAFFIPLVGFVIFIYRFFYGL